MSVTDKQDDTLTDLLRRSEQQLVEIRRGDFQQASENLEIVQKEIHLFLANPVALKLNREQARQLQKLHDLQRQAADMVGELKKELAQKITELRQGRTLHQVYRVQSSAAG